jgi:hypothetical protein
MSEKHLAEVERGFRPTRFEVVGTELTVEARRDQWAVCSGAFVYTRDGRWEDELDPLRSESGWSQVRYATLAEAFAAAKRASAEEAKRGSQATS